MELPFGMTKTPYLWNIDHHAFLSFMSYSMNNDELLDQFEIDTGSNLRSLTNTDPLSQIIDKETGYGREMFRKFSDWLVINHWGEEE